MVVETCEVLKLKTAAPCSCRLIDVKLLSETVMRAFEVLKSGKKVKVVSEKVELVQQREPLWIENRASCSMLEPVNENCDKINTPEESEMQTKHE